MLKRPLLLALALSSSRSCGSTTAPTPSPVASISGTPSPSPMAETSVAAVAPPPPATEIPGAIDLGEAPRTGGHPIFEIKHISTRGMKPPMKVLRFDVTLRNDRDEARWFLLPATLGGRPWLGDVDSLQRTELRGKGKDAVLIGRNQYDGRFNVLRLPARGVVTIRGLYTEIWIEAVPPFIGFDFVTATQIHLGAEPIEAWFEIDPTAPREANVEDDRFQIGSHELSRRESPGKQMVPVRVTEDRRLRFRVPLDPTFGFR